MIRTFMPWNALRDFDDLHARITGTGQMADQPAWVPAVDIEEDDKEFSFKFDLPELSKEAIEVKFDAGVLTVAGERKAPPTDEKRRFHRTERRVGAFARSFALPEDTDPSAITAEYTHGVLTVRLPKSERAKPKVIDVKVN